MEAFFYKGERVPPKLPLFVITNFFYVRKSRFLACLFTQLQGRMGDAPKGKAVSLVD
jgi:hypothetical protein